MKGLIVGAGRIGASFDSSTSKQVLTHAHAFKKHPLVTSFYFCDPNRNSLDKATKEWEVEGEEDLELALDKYSPDIVSICVPTKNHLEVVSKVAHSNCKIVLLEKPIALDISESVKIKKILEDQGKVVSVNYSRRFDQFIIDLKDKYDRGDLGQAVSASGLYTKGILNNGGHLINLFSFLFGKVLEQKSLSGIVDYIDSDPTLNCFLRYEKCDFVNIKTANEKLYTIFEYDLLFEKSRYRFFQSGFQCSVQEVRKDPLFPGYSDLTDGRICATNLDSSMYNYLDQAIQYYNGKNGVICNLEEAILTQEICKKFI